MNRCTQHDSPGCRMRCHNPHIPSATNRAAPTIRPHAGLPLETMSTTVNIPAAIKPRDGRFGSGPSKIRPEQIAAIDAGATTLMGTSHRQTPIRQLVASIREGLTEFFHIPQGYEIALGNGGASAFWEMACASLISRRAACGTYGSFSVKFASSSANAPFLEQPAIF